MSSASAKLVRPILTGQQCVKMSTAVAKRPKPVMRGHLGTNAQWMFVRAFTVATITSLGWYYWIVKPRKDGYREFYATYDPEKEFERMKKAGIFKCCPNGESPKPADAEEDEDEE